MANSNVRFYKLSALPSFNGSKHKGIFVHVTSKLIRTGKEGNYAYEWGEKLTNEEIQQIVIQIIEKPVLVPEWMASRRLDIVESGLWFGGENGWELLSNDTSSGAITAAIDAKIATLNVEGYAQATISGSTLTISGIKEDNGKIVKDTDNNLVIAIDGVYDETDNKIATESTVTNAINNLDVQTPIQAVTFNTSTVNGNTTLTFNGVKEENGKIVDGNGTGTFIVGDAKLKIQIGSTTIENVFSANAQADSTIQLDGLVFKKGDNNDVISVITPTAVSESNKLVTQQDVANLAGAMHYKTTIANADAWPTTVKAGDVYIATGDFEKEGQVIESGDMIVFNSETITDFTVVQSNITSGINSGQIAKNDGDLTPNNMVIATSEGIKTIGITESDLTGTTGKNERNLTYTNGVEDTTGEITLYHDVTITDDFTVIGKPFTKSIKISSTNRSIEIANNGNTGVVVDLVWNTSMDPDPTNQL